MVKAKKAMRLPATNPAPSPLTSSDMTFPPSCRKQNEATPLAVP